MSALIGAAAAPVAGSNTAACDAPELERCADRPDWPDWIDHPSGYLALSPRNQRFQVPGVPGFIAWREQGRHLVSLGGALAPTGAAREALLDAFLDEAARRKRRAIAVQVRESQADLFRSRGFTVNKFGTSYGVRLEKWSMAGTRFMKLRNKIKRARGAGLRVLQVGVDLPSDGETFARIGEVSARWLRAKRKKELDFMIGEIGGPGDPTRRIFVAVDAAGAFQGFITYVPAWGERRGWLHDLTRRLPEAPAGTMELVNAHAIERLQAEGTPWLHFGFTPFLFDGAEGPGASRALAWALGALRRWGSFLYPAQSQVEYKMKWAPDVTEAELVACRPLSLRAVLDLLLLTRSV